MTSLLCFQVRSEVRFEEIPGLFFFTFYFPLSLSSIFRLHQLPRSTLTHDSEHANRLTAAGECVRNFAEKSEMTRNDTSISALTGSSLSHENQNAQIVGCDMQLPSNHPGLTLLIKQRDHVTQRLDDRCNGWS